MLDTGKTERKWDSFTDNQSKGFISLYAPFRYRSSNLSPLYYRKVDLNIQYVFMSPMRTYLSFSGDWQNSTIILDSG